MNIAKKPCNKGKKTDCLINAPYLETLTTLSKKDMPKVIRDWLMSLQQDFPANPSRSLENDKPKTIQEICGRKQSKLSESSNQNMLFLKTSPDCYLQNQVWMKSQADLFHIALPFSGTWMKQGIMLSGRCWELQIAERHIKENGCGFWRSPNSNDWRNQGCSEQIYLCDQVRPSQITNKKKLKTMWRTPHSSDGEGGIMEMRDGVSGHYKLRDHVQEKNKSFWPTPKAQNANSPGEHGQGGKDLQTTIVGEGQLNPDWVEWLMGWPIFWTSLEPITELLWLDWDIDPADMEKPKGLIPSPRCALASYYAENDKTFKARGKETRQTLPRYAKQNPSTGLIPRIATKIKNRANRLKAIGNGQCPQCATKAWRILINYV